MIQIAAAKLPAPVREFRFHSERRFRFDLCYPDHMLAIEIEGATWSRGRHTRGAGYAADLTKYNLASMLGWRVLRFTTQQAINGEAVAWIQEFFEAIEKAASMVASSG